MNIPNYARYDYCLKKACEFLDQYSIQSFPVDPFEIIKKEKYGLMKYSELADELGYKYKQDIEKIWNKAKKHLIKMQGIKDIGQDRGWLSER